MTNMYTEQVQALMLQDAPNALRDLMGLYAALDKLARDIRQGQNDAKTAIADAMSATQTTSLRTTVGTAAIVMDPKPTISYNATALDQLIIESDVAAAFLKPLRRITPKAPYLTIKLNKKSADTNEDEEA
jgi:hypothetical protein